MLFHKMSSKTSIRCGGGGGGKEVLRLVSRIAALHEIATLPTCVASVEI